MVGGSEPIAKFKTCSSCAATVAADNSAIGLNANNAAPNNTAFFRNFFRKFQV